MITDDFVAVIDGSTSKSPVRIAAGCSNGRYCMTLIAGFVRRADASTCVEEFCNDLTETIRDHYRGLDMRRLEEHPEERLTASCIVYSRHQRQIWMIGDCQCLVDGQLYENPKPCEAVIAEKRAAIIHSLIADGKATVDSLRTNDTARQTVIPELIETMRGQNHDYAVVDGFPIPMEHVRIINLTPAPHSIVLASDGYPFLLPTLTESEAALRRQLTEDPLNAYTFKATKAFAKGNNSFDDRTYVRFRT
ncbi:MAG: hypothetical protein Q4C43_11460 [Prevotella sp.]|nr:hypothetical protein [Prevotella sp.]